jgi:hypothetical protein
MNFYSRWPAPKSFCLNCKWHTSLQQTSNSSGTNSDDLNEQKKSLGTSDDHGDDDELSASVKSINHLMKNSSYVGWKIWCFIEKILKCQISWKFICGNRVVLRRQTDKQSDGQTDMTKLTVAFRNVVNKSKDWGTAQFLSAITICHATVLLSKNIPFFICKPSYTVQC